MSKAPARKFLLRRFSFDTIWLMKPAQRFFELELQSEGIAFPVTAEIMPPGLEDSEAKAKVVEEWTLHFAISAPIHEGAYAQYNPRNGCRGWR